VTRPGRRRRADSRYAEQAGRLAELLRDRRTQAGMSQEQLAGRAHVAVATVRKIEKGVVVEPGYFTVLALMRALGDKSEDPAMLGRRISIVANCFDGLLRSNEEILVTGH
jgi:transcriptional regulator with XRE-family HTH domain